MSLAIEVVDIPETSISSDLFIFLSIKSFQSFFVADHFQNLRLPFLPVQLVGTWGKFDHYVAVDDLPCFLVAVVAIIDRKNGHQHSCRFQYFFMTSLQIFLYARY